MTSQRIDPKRSAVRSVVHVSREYTGIASAGGVGDVTAGLARASAKAGIATHVFLPYYRRAKEVTPARKTAAGPFRVPMKYGEEERFEDVTICSFGGGDEPTIHLVKSNRYDYIWDHPVTIERHGIYGYTEQEAKELGRPELEGRGYIDFFAMNVLLVKGTLRALGELNLTPDVIHCHDGHAALLPVIARFSTEGLDPLLGYVPSVVTIHNAGEGFRQEISDLDFGATVCGLPRTVVNGCLLNGNFDPLLAGSIFAGAVNTVSENYAHELQNTGQDAYTGWFGHGLRKHGIELKGITNGIDPEKWDPRRPKETGIYAGFDPAEGDLVGKETCKRKLLEDLRQQDGFGDIRFHGTLSYDESAPLLTFISRLAEQKGMDMLVEAVWEVLRTDPDVQLLGLGDGDPVIAERLVRLAEQEEFRGRVCVALGFDRSLAVKIYAAGDFFLLPSRFEPCGLTDLYAQLFGNIPIVQRVGGLVKTIDGRFGFSYVGGERELVHAIRRALKVYRERGRKTLTRMQTDAARNVYDNFQWDTVLENKYLPLYAEAARTYEPRLPY